ncbi:MAG: hypothetical protein ACK5HR_07420, partial [Mycoplasmatales bacterium]
MKKIIIGIMSLIILTIISTVFTFGLFNEYRLNRETKEYLRSEVVILFGGHKLNGNHYPDITTAIGMYEASRLGVIDGDLFEDLQGKTAKEIEKILVHKIRKQTKERAKDPANKGLDPLGKWLDEE